MYQNSGKDPDIRNSGWKLLFTSSISKKRRAISKLTRIGIDLREIYSIFEFFLGQIDEICARRLLKCDYENKWLKIHMLLWSACFVLEKSWKLVMKADFAMKSQKFDSGFSLLVISIEYFSEAVIWGGKCSENKITLNNIEYNKITLADTK